MMFIVYEKRKMEIMKGRHRKRHFRLSVHTVAILDSYLNLQAQKNSIERKRTQEDRRNDVTTKIQSNIEKNHNTFIIPTISCFECLYKKLT